MFSSFAQSRQQAGIARTQGNYSGAIADQNAGLSDRQATDAIARGDESANRLALSGRQLAGAQKAAAAGDGVDPNSGSAAELQADTGALSAFDANTIRANAAREAWNTISW